MTTTPVIEARELGFTYPGARSPAVNGIDFQVAAGEVFGFLGPSGAGKSTTQKILTGLLTESVGELRVFGRSIAEHGREYYERIGVSFEVPNVYGRLTGRENLEFFASLYRGRTADPAELLARVGLTDAAGERAGNYSKGMRMRLNFCRALLRDPELLFLDEPTSGQDPQNAHLLKKIIREQRDRGATIFLTTHDMSVAAELCDRVAFLVDGRITLIDSPRSLMVRYGQRRVRVEYGSEGENGGGGGDEMLRSTEFDLDGLGANEQFLSLLRSSSVQTIHSLDASLEDVFLRVTGRSLAP